MDKMLQVMEAEAIAYSRQMNFDEKGNRIPKKRTSMPLEAKNPGAYYGFMAGVDAAIEYMKMHKKYPGELG